VNKLKISISVFLFFILSYSYAQKKEVIDSLWKVYKTSKNDSLKLKSANYLAFHYIFKTPIRADSILTASTSFAQKNKLNFGLTELTNTRGIYYDVLGQKDSSKVYFQHALKRSRDFNYPNIEVMCINNLGMFCWNNGEFKEALNYFYQTLEFIEEHDSHNDRKQSISYNNIGLIYQELNQYNKAIEYHNKALKIRLEDDRTKDIAGSYNNLAICYQNLNQLIEAEKYINLAIDYAKQADQTKMVFQFHETLGNILNLQQKFKEAEEAYLVAMQMPEDYKNFNREKFLLLSNLIDVYNNTNQFDKAKQAINEADILIRQDSSLYNFSESFYINSVKTYYAIREPAKAEVYFDAYLGLKDSLFSKENAKALANIEAKLKTKEKEAELAQAKAELLEKELKVRRQNLFIYGSISALIILILLLYFIIQSSQLKNKKLLKEAELNAALVKIELKNELEEQRLRISRDLHDNIGSQLTFVISSLQYIQYQKEIKLEDIKKRLEQIGSFTQQTIQELRDTIWAMNKEELILSDLINRLDTFINQLNIQEVMQTSITDKVEAKKETVYFTAIEGIQIYRVIQESINNAVKHADAKVIKIKFDLISNQLKIQIIDNGVGFDMDKVSYGNGLNNLEKRAQRLQSKLEIKSEIAKGTSIKLLFPLKNKKSTIKQ
jgi:signal transduction histidine kinase